MPGTRRSGFVLQARERHLLRELEIMRIVDRAQAKIVVGFGSDSRANRRLRKLTQAGFLKRFFLGTTAAGQKALYSLSEQGAAAVPISYFTGVTKIKRPKKQVVIDRIKKKRPQPLPVPSANDVLDICKKEEDQTIEFKAAGTDVRKVTKEIAAMLNTRQGGIILYGVDDDGTIHGSDVTRQKFDQPLQNSVKNSVAPAAIITLKSVTVLGSEILVVIVPPWNRNDVYQFDEKVYIRKGTNVFGVKPEELKKLHRGDYVI